MSVKGLTRTKLVHSGAALLRQNRFYLQLGTGEGTLLFDNGQQLEARVPYIRGYIMGEVDQIVASIVKIDCRGPNVVDYGICCLLRMREKTSAVAVCKLVKRFQECW